MSQDLGVQEYRSLRNELRQLAGSISRWQLVGFVAAGFGVLISALSGVGPSGIGPVIGTLLVIAGCIYGVIHDLTSILRIAAYLQVFHEGKETGALWENRLENARGAKVFVPLRGYMTPIPALWWAGLLCTLPLRWLPALHGRLHYAAEWTLLWFPLAAAAVWIVFWLFTVRSYRALASGRFKEATIASFRELADSERASE